MEGRLHDITTVRIGPSRDEAPEPLTSSLTSRRIEEISGSVTATYRYYSVSRQAYYRWLKRSEAEGLEGLKDRV